MLWRSGVVEDGVMLVVLVVTILFMNGWYIGANEWQLVAIGGTWWQLVVVISSKGNKDTSPWW